MVDFTTVFNKMSHNEGGFQLINIATGQGLRWHRAQLICNHKSGKSHKC